MTHLPADIPIYGMQARGIMQPQLAPKTLCDMAAEYLQSIRQIQPIGPYNLLGWSFGGLVAHEIATLLQDRGEKIAILAVLDAYPDEKNEFTENDESLNDDKSLADQLKAMGYHVGDEPLQLSSPLSILERQEHMFPSLAEHEVAAIIEVFKNNGRLADDFHPKRFVGDMLLFVATKRESPPPIDTWRPYVSGEIHIHEVDCEHVNMMRPIPLTEIGIVLASEFVQQIGTVPPLQR